MSISDAILSSILQVILFSAIPFIFYVVRWRRARGFLDWVGLRRPTRRAMLYATFFVAITAPLTVTLYLVPAFWTVTLAEGTTGGNFAALEPSAAAVGVVMVSAFVQAGLAEELLFRGFIAKRLIGWLGFGWGNSLQAAIFSSPHLLIFATPGGAPISTPAIALLFAFAFAIGWIFGFLNECIGNGSMVPSWWCHGAANTIAYTAAMFV